MMEKLKAIWGYIVAVIVGVVGLFLYFFSRRGDEINALKSKIALAQTEKETDLIESEIRAARDRQSNLDKQNKELDQALAELEAKRAQVKENVAKTTNPQEIADYWNKN